MIRRLFNSLLTLFSPVLDEDVPAPAAPAPTPPGWRDLDLVATGTLYPHGYLTLHLVAPVDVAGTLSLVATGSLDAWVVAFVVDRPRGGLRIPIVSPSRRTATLPLPRTVGLARMDRIELTLQSLQDTPVEVSLRLMGRGCPEGSAAIPFGEIRIDAPSTALHLVIPADE